MPHKMPAILAADAIGSSRLVGDDEAGTPGALESRVSDLVTPAIGQQGGRIVEHAGGGVLAWFPSAAGAVAAAVAILAAGSGRQADRQGAGHFDWRIGVNLGGGAVRDDDPDSDAVTVAARLREAAPLNGVAISDAVYQALRGDVEIAFMGGGRRSLRDIAEPVQLWTWSPDGAGRDDRRVLRFEAFDIDLDAQSLRVGGDEVHVEPQVFDLIALLVRNPGRLISHEEIIERVWRGRIVSDSAIATRVNAARRALGDDGTAQRVIRTIRGRGFRFELTPLPMSRGPVDQASDSVGRMRFVLSCTPHGYSLLMASRNEEASEARYDTLPVYLAEAASRHGGLKEAENLAVFDRGEDALNCAREILDSIERRCRALATAARWTVKVGIGYGTLDHGFAYALAGRMDAMADPGGICITRGVVDRIGADLNVSVEAVDDADGAADADPYRITAIDDWHPAIPAPGRPAQLANLEIPEPNEVSVVVLPFEVAGADEELHEVALGLRIEIQNALVQLSGVMPMAAGTAAAFAGATSPDAAAALGVRHVVQGHMRSIGRRARLMLELYDHHRGGVAWSQSYDGSLDDGFEFQDQMTMRVVRALDVKVLSGEQARIWHKSFSDLKAIRLQYAGIRDFFRMNRESMRSARESFERLHEMHPDVSIGATWTALCHWFDVQRGWCEDPAEAMQRAEEWANIAIGMEDADGQAHTALCHIHLMRREFDEAERVGASAVTVRPSCANANGFYAHALYYCGRLEKAMHHARLAMRFTPAYPPIFLAVLAGALHASGDHDAAIAVAKEGQRINPNEAISATLLVSALWEAGRRDEARLAAVRQLRAEPAFDVSSFIDRLPFRDSGMAWQLRDNCGACFGELD